jgi:putative exporter of polyketide antibiotics
MMVTFVFLLIGSVFLVLLGTIDTFFYDSSIIDTFIEIVAPKAETRRYLVSSFVFIGLLYSLFVDYRLKKNK